jgi:hypothetical protein
MSRCLACNGTGKAPVLCAVCKGLGNIYSPGVIDDGRQIRGGTIQIPCTTCKGIGTLYDGPRLCPLCEGAGIQPNQPSPPLPTGGIPTMADKNKPRISSLLLFAGLIIIAFAAALFFTYLPTSAR